MITREEVAHIAKLARIELDGLEKSKFEGELSAILGFVEKLNEIDTGDLEPLTGGAELDSVTRGDEQISEDLEGHAPEIVAAAPGKKDGWIKVKAVF